MTSAIHTTRRPHETAREAAGVGEVCPHCDETGVDETARGEIDASHTLFLQIVPGASNWRLRTSRRLWVRLTDGIVNTQLERLHASETLCVPQQQATLPTWFLFHVLLPNIRSPSFNSIQCSTKYSHLLVHSYLTDLGFQGRVFFFFLWRLPRRESAPLFAR